MLLNQSSNYFNLSINLYKNIILFIIIKDLNKYPMPIKRKNMRLVVLGDNQVGKTSLVHAIMSDTIPSQNIKTLKKVILPPQLCIYSKDVFTEIIDTDNDVDNKLGIHKQMQQADIILLIYDISDQQSIIRLQGHWLPIINRLRSNVPIILVGNKIDKKELQTDKELDYINIKAILKSVIKKYRQVQMGIQCSAYYDRNIKKVLNCAQRAVLYPLAPLYDSRSKELTEKFKKAIKRIFRVLDKNLVGSITDNELKNLQQRVFQTQLNGEDIKVIKQIILRELQQYNEDCIKLNGFEALQKKCIQMLKIQVCWSILRYFNYNNNLEIDPIEEAFIYDEKNGETLQLSFQVIQFLQRIYVFSMKSKRNDENVMDYLFSCAPQIPLEEFRIQDQMVELQKFIMGWNMFAFLNYKECYRNLLYIGYEGGLDVAFKKNRAKKTYSDILRLKQKKIFSVLFVANDVYLFQNQINLLFKNGLLFTGELKQLTRQTYLYTDQKKQSKLLLLFKINQNNIQDFLANSNICNQIDLVLTFEQNQKRHQKIEQSSFIQTFKDRFFSHTMFRELKHSQMERILYNLKIPSLDLQSFPVQYKDENWKELFNEVLKTFDNVELGYSSERLQRLKKQSDKLNKVFIGLSLLGVTVLGCAIFNKNPLHLLKQFT